MGIIVLVNNPGEQRSQPVELSPEREDQTGCMNNAIQICAQNIACSFVSLNMFCESHAETLEYERHRQPQKSVELAAEGFMSVCLPVGLSF